MDDTTRFALDQQLRPPVPPPPSSSLPVLPTSPATPRLTVHHWSDSFLSTPVHSTFIFLHSTVFIHLSLSTSSPPPLSSLALSFHSASSSALDSVSSTPLLPSSPFSSSLSARLCRHFQQHFLCSVDTGEADAPDAGDMRGTAADDVQLWVERRISTELKACRENGLWKG